jgi:hypothetical protein
MPIESVTMVMISRTHSSTHLQDVEGAVDGGLNEAPHLHMQLSHHCSSAHVTLMKIAGYM